MTFDRALIANKRILLYVNLENFYVNKDYISGKKLVLEDLMNNDIKTN